MKMELRVNQTNIEANEDGSMTVNGYVNKTEQFSEMLGRNEKFKERISRGAFKRAIEKAKEIHFLAEHDGEKILSSTRNGSLELSEDANGLYMSATITPTSWGKDYYELIKSGILKNMSFGFRSIKDSWKKVEVYFERTIHELELFEVSVVKDPAYSQSSISARGIDVVEEVKVPDEVKKKTVRNIQEMSRKALIELRNDLLEQSQSYETRGLTEEQEYEQLKSQVRDIDIQLKKYDKKEVRNMIEVLNPNDVKVEKRGFEAFLKGNLYSEEVRAITTSSTPGQLTVPTSISDQIIKKLEEVAPLFAQSKQFPSVHGYLEVLKEAGIGGAQWLGEMENATPADFTMSKVKLEQKRLTTAIELSQQLINDAGFDIVNYAIDVLSRRIAVSVNQAIVNGNGTGQMEGFLTATLAPESVVQTATTGAVTTDDVLGLFNSMHPELVEGAVFVMNRDTWSKVSKLKDAENRYYLVDFKNGNGANYYTMLGLPVMISDVMPNIAAGNKAIGLINMGEGYGTLIKKGIEVQHVYADSTQALRGSQLIVASIYLDGKIINDQAIRLLSIK
ncbi:phage major capsid protein [Bacillus thuringiensis]|uniref:phage major capsid protein n=1 Tax=Bacillus tropicus TaxID=2026188 RepID=UPI000B44C8A6|nr:phage major capsid protein [Bacillus tropicus]MED3036079.1 phage major capsid protein [Bacillus tropicus]OTX77166.1 phage major capsid protein [Bacillus thuringiensis serovar chanpaisis]PNK24211.1 phage major capsid protein [Bacillus thuringiensis]